MTLAAVGDAALTAAVAEAEAVRRTAQARAEDLLGSARAEAAAVVSQRWALAERLADAEERDQLARARAEARETVLRAQELVLTDAIEAAHAAARRLSRDPRYGQLETRLVADARERLSGAGRVEIVPAAGGGFMARAGSRQIDDSLDAQVDRCLEAMAGEMGVLWRE
jgi:vacuolar-type H+-ATPase subunit E/Vma4